MEIVNLILNIAVIVLIFLVGLFTKNYLPSYMDKKGENLATKEDNEEITRKTEEVQREFKEEFEAFSSDMRFKYDFFYKQYSELYCKLYAIIIQSEYVRHFIQITDGTEYLLEFENEAMRMFQGILGISEYLYRLRELELMYDGKIPIMVQERVKWPKKIGRNELCPCGSGKKYKRCHGR